MNCPVCNTGNAYVGFTDVQCLNPECQNYDPNFTGLTPPVPPPEPDPFMQPNAEPDAALLSKIDWDEIWYNNDALFGKALFETLAGSLCVREGANLVELYVAPWNLTRGTAYVRQIQLGRFCALSGKRYTKDAQP